MNNKKSTVYSIIWIIAFVTYNIVFFTLSGFKGHTSTFWVSWSFMILAFLSMGVIFLLLGKKGMFLKDWFFGFPIFKHTAIYVVAEFILSTVFVICSNVIGWKLPFALQVLLFAVYLVFAISCFVARDTIKEVKENVAIKTRSFKLLRVDAEMLVSKCNDESSKKIFADFAENVRNSDPMSSELLEDLENRLSETINECSAALEKDDYEAALTLCSKAKLLLEERNKKCMALK